MSWTCRIKEGYHFRWTELSITTWPLPLRWDSSWAWTCCEHTADTLPHLSSDGVTLSHVCSPDVARHLSRWHHGSANLRGCWAAEAVQRAGREQLGLRPLSLLYIQLVSPSGCCKQELLDINQCRDGSSCWLWIWWSRLGALPQFSTNIDRASLFPPASCCFLLWSVAQEFMMHSLQWCCF